MDMHTSDSLSKSGDQGVYVVNENYLGAVQSTHGKARSRGLRKFVKRSRNLLGEQAHATKRKKTRLEIQDDCDKVQ